jgi:uncharacterized SAM-binding protein YcdF (DUF218 family)
MRTDERRSRRFSRRIIGGGAVLVALVLGSGTAALWPRDDVPRDPAAVVVLGGAGIERTDLGIELSERYDVPLVLSSSASSFGEARGLRCGREAICLAPRPETTTGEARDVARLAEERGWDHVTVATSRFHTTRARVLFRQCMGDEVTVVGAPRRPNGEVGLRSWLKEIGGTLAAWTFARAC